MFEFDAGKLIIVGIIALIFIPPKDLPRVLRQAGQFVGKMRRMASEFQGQFMDAMREADMADLRQEAQKLADATKLDLGQSSLGRVDMGLGEIEAHNRSIMKELERKSETVRRSPEPADPADETVGANPVADADGAKPVPHSA